MNRILVSPRLTAFLSTQAVPAKLGKFYEGRVDVLFGRAAYRVRHVCLSLRDTPRQALRDAKTDARKLIKMWPPEL